MIILSIVLIYILIGSCVFISIIRDNNQSSNCAVLYTLAAPFIILGYPYFLIRRLHTSRLVKKVF